MKSSRWTTAIGYPDRLGVVGRTASPSSFLRPVGSGCPKSARPPAGDDEVRAAELDTCDVGVHGAALDVKNRFGRPMVEEPVETKKSVKPLKSQEPVPIIQA